MLATQLVDEYAFTKPHPNQGGERMRLTEIKKLEIMRKMQKWGHAENMRSFLKARKSEKKSTRESKKNGPVWLFGIIKRNASFLFWSAEYCTIFIIKNNISGKEYTAEENLIANKIITFPCERKICENFEISWFKKMLNPIAPKNNTVENCIHFGVVIWNFTPAKKWGENLLFPSLGIVTVAIFYELLTRAGRQCGWFVVKGEKYEEIMRGGKSKQIAGGRKSKSCDYAELCQTCRKKREEKTGIRDYAELILSFAPPPKKTGPPTNLPLTRHAPPTWPDPLLLSSHLGLLGSKCEFFAHITYTFSIPDRMHPWSG